MYNKGEEIVKESFIERSIILNGKNKYGYDKLPDGLIPTKSIVKIYCNDCKKYFDQLVNNHLNNKYGCPICGIKKSAKTRGRTLEQFIELSKAKYTNDAFDYSQSIYINEKSKIKLICKKHNHTFEQIVKNHLNGFIGCEFCQ